MKTEVEWLDKAIEMYHKDYPFMKIGKKLGVDRKKVSRELRAKGYTSKYSFGDGNEPVWRKYNFNQEYFEDIDTEEKAYWLGFAYADGYVNSTKTSFELSLNEKDLGHMEKFRKAIDGDMPIRVKNKKVGEKEYKGYSMQVNSEKFKSDLIDKGCIENKSLMLRFPNYSQVPKRLMNDFIRGYADGDGCYYLKHSRYEGIEKTTVSKSMCFELVGTDHFLRGVINHLGLHTNKIHLLRKSTDKRAKRINYSGPYALQIVEQLYSNANIYLERKYQKIIQIIADIDGNIDDKRA